MNDPLYQRQLQMVAQAKNFFVDLWQKVNDFFISYQWQEILFGLKVASVIISLLLLLAIIFLLVKIIIFSPLQKSLFKSSKSSPIFNKKKILKRWGKIDRRLKSGIETNYKLAVIEAEKLFDIVLKNIGYGAEKKLASIDEIKKAGKIKDNIIEDKKFKLSKEQAEEAIEAYKKGLEELGIL